jgi:hypothetical protein
MMNEPMGRTRYATPNEAVDITFAWNELVGSYISRGKISDAAVPKMKKS